MDSKKGFTLLEILVAITIFAIAIALVSYSFRYSINVVKYINYSYAEDLQNISKLRDSIASTFFFLTQDDSKRDEPTKVFKFFFKGDENSIEYITCKPILIKDREIVLTRLRKEKNNFIIEEYPIYDKKINYKMPSFEGINPQKKILITNIKSLSFSYLKAGRKITFINNDIPDGVKIKIKRESPEKESNYFFKIKSNAFIKKELGESLYEEY